MRNELQLGIPGCLLLVGLEARGDVGVAPSLYYKAIEQGWTRVDFIPDMEV
jgi:hypothetical protein